MRSLVALILVLTLTACNTASPELMATVADPTRVGQTLSPAQVETCLRSADFRRNRETLSEATYSPESTAYLANRVRGYRYEGEYLYASRIAIYDMTYTFTGRFSGRTRERTILCVFVTKDGGIEFVHALRLDSDRKVRRSDVDAAVASICATVSGASRVEIAIRGCPFRPRANAL